MLTARAEPIDRVLGLEMGADDYLAKPFEPRELLARIRNVLRRTEALPANLEPLAVRRARFSRWVFDLEHRHLVDPDDRVVVLSGAEFRLLRVFIAHANKVLSREQLVALSSGRNYEAQDRAIDLQVSRLRNKLGDDGGPDGLIKTVRNEGYVLASVGQPGISRDEAPAPFPVLDGRAVVRDPAAGHERGCDRRDHAGHLQAPAEFERQNLNRIADRLQGYVNLLDGNPELRERLLAIGGPSVRALQPGARLGRADTALMEVLDDRPGPVSRAHVHFASFRSCIPKLQDLLPPPPPGTGGRRASATRRSFRPSAARWT
jgi:DNA-binding winged helix-turn-helix (wHTH) protein